MQSESPKWLGSRQRAVLALFKDARHVSKYMIQQACPWAQVEFFLDRTLDRMVQKGLVRFQKYRGYVLAVNKHSAVWRKIRGN